MSYLLPINTFSKADNLGGLLLLMVARASTVISIPSPTGSSINGDILFEEGQGFVPWAVTFESARAQSKGNRNREGNTRSNSLPFIVPKDRLAIKNQFEQASDDEFIILATDGNGHQKLYGTKESPYLFRYDHDTGQSLTTLNAYAGEFYYNGPDNVYFYTGTITQQAPGSAPAIVKFTTGEVVAVLNPSDILIVSSDFVHTFSIIPGTSYSATPAIVKWDTGEIIATLQPGDILLIDTDFSFDFEIIGNL